MTWSSDDPSSLDELDQQDHDGDDQQDVDEAAHRDRGDHPESPEDEEDYEQCPEHGVSFLPFFARSGPEPGAAFAGEGERSHARERAAARIGTEFLFTICASSWHHRNCPASVRGGRQRISPRDERLHARSVKILQRWLKRVLARAWLLMSSLVLIRGGEDSTFCSARRPRWHAPCDVRPGKERKTP